LQQNIIMIKPICFGVDPNESFFRILGVLVVLRYISKRKYQLAACLVLGERETPFLRGPRAARRSSCLQRRDSIQGWMERPTARLSGTPTMYLPNLLCDG